VLGAKRVKAIAVLGRRHLRAADGEAFMAGVDAAMKQIFENAWVPHKRDHGTIGSLDIMHELGITPVANFERGTFEGIDAINSRVFGALVEARLACATCPMACSKGISWQQRGPRFGIEGPEYETAALFGPNCRVDDPQAIIRANLICNREGLDTISAGTVIGMVLHAADDGRISLARLGLSPEAPAGQMVAEMLHQISHREGLGEVLAHGARYAAEKLGFPDLAPHVKGLEFPAYDPRVSPGMSLAYMTSDRGACHLRTYPFGREVSGVLPRWDLEQKAEFVKRQQDEKAAQECLGVCQFPYGIGLLTNDLPRLMSAATGDQWTYRRLRIVGERVWTLSRAFSAQLGVGRRADYLPQKFSDTAMPDGPGAGHVLSRAQQDQLLTRYYALRGWDDDGRPTAALWQQLDLASSVGPFPLADQAGD
jgi:aldehyde:ferredoxin oxidoreductase